MRDKGRSWPGLRNIEGTVRASRPSVVKAIEELEAAGLLAVSRTPNKRNVYFLVSQVDTNRSSFLTTIVALVACSCQ